MTTLNLEAKNYPSRVLTEWAQSRPNSASRMGIQNAGVAISGSSVSLNELFQSIPAPSGFQVTDQTAMQVSTVYACLTKLAGAITQLPLEKYHLNKDNTREQYPRDTLWWLLNEEPDAEWTAASWKEWIVRCVALRGDQFTRILRPNLFSPKIVGLRPMHPDNVVVRRVADTINGNSILRYWCTDPLTGMVDVVDQDDMLHFAGFGFDGRYGRSLSMIQYAARNGIANSLAAADYAGRSIGEGAMPQISLTYPNKLNAEQAKLLRESFVAAYGGGSNGAGSRKLPLVMAEGGKAEALSISPIDMQLLESRRFEREDICQALGVPPVLIGDNTKSTSWGTGIEQITLGFVKYTVKPHLVRWQEEMNRKLFRKAGPFVEFDLDGLLRGDTKAQDESFRAGLGGPGTGDGYLTVNEIRKIKNMPPIEGGDVLFKAASGPAPSAKPGADDPGGQESPNEPPDGDEPTPKPKKVKK